MKLIFSLLLIGVFTLTPSANVYICQSANAYAYHAKENCKGLDKCNHSIKQVSLETAKELGKKKPCGYCYK